MFVLTLSAHITIEKGKIIELIKSKRMPIIEISSLSHPGVEIFSTLLKPSCVIASIPTGEFL